MKELKDLIRQLNSLRPFNAITLKRIEEHFFLKYNQQSNAIEGNTLTLSETKILLENGITAKGKPFKDHLDIINHRNAIGYLRDLVRERPPLSERIIKEFNYLLLKGTDEEYQAGQYRTMPVIIQGTAHIPPQPYLVASKMEALVADYCHLSRTDDPIEIINRIARLHSDFVYIHPFIDGNGRTGRLIMNFELMKNGLPIAILSADHREEYYEALAYADNKNYQYIEDLLQNSVKNAIQEILTIVG